MSQTEDQHDDWTAWQEAWQTPAAGDPSLIAGLERRFQRQRRLALALTGLDALTAVGLGALGLFVLGSSGSLATRVWALSVLVFTAGLLGFAVWNRRDALFSSARPAADFLALLRLRLSRRERAPKFLAGFVAVEMAFGLASFARWNPQGLPLALAAYAGMAALLVPAWRWYRARLRRERAQLEALAGEAD